MAQWLPWLETVKYYVPWSRKQNKAKSKEKQTLDSSSWIWVGWTSAYFCHSEGTCHWVSTLEDTSEDFHIVPTFENSLSVL